MRILQRGINLVTFHELSDTMQNGVDLLAIRLHDAFDKQQQAGHDERREQANHRLPAPGLQPKAA